MEDDILIDKYLKGLLSKNDEKLFLERLASDSELKENFELEEQLFNALDENSWSFTHKNNAEVNDYKQLLEQDDLQNLKETLSTANLEHNAKSLKPKKPLFYYFAAASIIALLGFQFLFNKTDSNQDMYYDYVALNDLPSFVSRSDNSNNLTKAQNYFENKKYKEALLIFDSISSEQEDTGTLLIYKGISETELGNYEVAELTFDGLIQSNLLDAEKGYWYKALAFVKANKIEKSKETLTEIISRKLYKHIEAKELLEKIKD